MNFVGTRTIETPRLILRKVRLDDVETAFKNYASDDNVTKYLSWDKYNSISDMENFIKNLITSYDDPKIFEWVIELKSIGEVIGSICGKGIDEKASRVEIGYCIGEKWWGQGITSEALKAVIKFFFYEVDVNRIEAFHDVRNLASGRVMQKCGMQFEGILRERELFRYGVFDSCIYSILKRDLKVIKNFQK